MGEQKFALKPVAEACEEALVTTDGRGDEEEMREYADCCSPTMPAAMTAAAASA